MAKIRLTKEFRFESAHVLLGYDGPCRNIHGHSYRMAVTVIGQPIADDLSPKNGMVMDFGLLKKIVNEAIVNPFDHALIINDKSPGIADGDWNKVSQKLIIVPYQPSCENMLIDFADRIINKLPDTAKLHHIRLDETPNSYAEWYAEDNLG
jgi:6-pyruvoyltetrahydropterin/6-carboxytetrahydropterin synthase